MRNTILLNLKSRMGECFSTLGLLMVGVLLSTTLGAQSYTLEKNVLGVEEATTAGNINILYEVTFTNVSEAPGLTDIQIQDNVLVDVGTGFVGVAQMPTFGPSTATTNPTLNANYSADFADPQIFQIAPTGTGFITPGQFVTVRFSIEVNPAMISGDVTNTAVASAALSGGSPIFPLPTAQATLTNCWDDCVIACNNQVNISVNTMCEAEILADMVLEGDFEECADLGFFKVEIFDLNDNPIGLPIDQSYIGSRLKVTVTNIACGNSCWGNLLIEDKTPPVLNCDEVTVRCNEDISPFNSLIGFPVPLANITRTTDPNVFIASSVDACGDVNLEYRDSLVKYDCANPRLSSTIYRKWTATDASGLMVMCQDTINFIRGTIADITLPEHYDGQPGNQPALECGGSWCALPNGFPRPEDCGTGAPSGIFCGNIQFDYSDDTINTCGASYKLFRTWLIIDWCDPDNKVEFIQRIKVIDEDAPEVVCPTRDPIIVSMSRWECSAASYIVPEPVFDPGFTGKAPLMPVIIDECSDWTYSIKHLSINERAKSPGECSSADLTQTFETKNVRQLADGRWEVFDIPAGCNWIKYEIVDDCGNRVECGLEIFVEDDISPIAVCHEHTVVSLTSDGKARVNASTFDDGSHDNCELGKMEVRRMSSGNCPAGVQDDTQFRDYVEFCCEDIADNPIMVVLRVWDECGDNYSECMVEVTVQDKLPPIITDCPGPRSITCEDDYTPLSQFGMAEAFDNCNVVVTADSNFQINDCGVGRIIRTFTATDDGGRTATCSQVITINDTRPFTRNDITFPRDRDLFNGCMEDTDPSNTGVPTFRNEDDCNQIATSYEDLVFSQVDGSCLKILRQWRVVDWCQFDRSKANECYPDNPGRWCHTQVIKVNDVEGPSFTSDCNNRVICIDGPGCTVDTALSATAFDKCTPSNLLIWRYELESPIGNIIASGNRSSFNRTYTEGEYRLTWYVEDQCGNVEDCSYDFEVEDCKKPTPYCKTGITTVVMPINGTIELWASDFDAGSFDNCTDTSDLDFSFSSNRNETNKTFSCGDIANGVVDTIEVTIYVWDEEGNSDFCRTNLILQDNQDVCPDVAGAGSMIAGLVTNLNQDQMRDVEVNLDGGSMNNSMNYMTDVDGKFAFPNMTNGESYLITPKYNDDHMNGISTLDLVIMQRHLLGLSEIDSPYKLIAADVNGNEEISANDISELRKLILGIYAELPSNDAWRFVSENHQFANPNHPFPFKEEIQIDQLTGDAMDNDFMAIKVGDVSGDAEGSGLTNNGTRGAAVSLEADEAKVQGSQVMVPVLLSQEDIQTHGMQFTISFAAEHVEFLRVESGQMTIGAQDVALVDASEGLVTLSWFDIYGATFNSEDALFNIVLETDNGQFSNDWIEVNSDITNAEWYDLDGQTGSLSWNGGANDTEGYVLYQNTPNPFKGSTMISFDLPKQVEYRLEIFDVSGKILNVIEGMGHRGQHSIEIDLSNYSESSVLYYQLETESFTATKKMVIIE